MNRDQDERVSGHQSAEPDSIVVQYVHAPCKLRRRSLRDDRRRLLPPEAAVFRDDDNEAVRFSSHLWTVSQLHAVGRICAPAPPFQRSHLAQLSQLACQNANFREF